MRHRACAAAFVLVAAMVAIAGCEREPARDDERLSAAVPVPVPAPVPDSQSHRASSDTAAFTCPMHPLVVAPGAGSCPDCRMALVPQSSSGAFLCVEHFDAVDVRPGACRRCARPLVATPTETVWRCPRHPEMLLDDAQPCPICETDLEAAVLGVAWVCPEEFIRSLGGDAASTDLAVLRLDGQALGFSTHEVAFTDGSCARCGLGRLRVTFGLPHGDHRPRHGGQFRMAPDNWHHIELAVRPDGALALWFYDNYTRPLAARGFAARVRQARLDPDAGLVDGDAALPFVPSVGGERLEARLGDFELPLYLTLDVELDRDPERFDFAFHDLAPPPDAGVPLSSTGDRVREPLATPATPAETIAELLIRDVRLRLCIHRREFDTLYVPAFEAKDLALGLEATLDERVSVERRRAVGRAVRDVVRAAWLIDIDGDQGEARRVVAHYQEFARGVAALERLFPFATDGSVSPDGVPDGVPFVAPSPAVREASELPDPPASVDPPAPPKKKAFR